MVIKIKRIVAFLLPTLFFALLIFSAVTAHAEAYTYERDPSSSVIETSGSSEFVQFSFSADPTDPEWVDWPSEGINYYSVAVIGEDNSYNQSECIELSEIYDYPIDLDIGAYTGVFLAGYEDQIGCLGGEDNQVFALNLEYIDGFEPVFEVVYVEEIEEDTGFADMISGANIQFASTTGFDIPAVADWAGDNLIKLLIGSGLNIIYSLRYWIVALVIIGAILAFAYRAFRFFKH